MKLKAVHKKFEVLWGIGNVKNFASVYSLEMTETFLKHEKWDPEVGWHTSGCSLSAQLVNMQQPGLSWASGVIRAWFALCLCGTPAGLASVRPPISNVSPKLQSVRDGFVVSSEISSLLREKYVFMWVVYLKQHMIHWYWCVRSIYYWR